MVETARINCSWCLYNIFIPISKQIVKCYNCGNLKCVDDGIEIEPSYETESSWDVDY